MRRRNIVPLHGSYRPFRNEYLALVRGSVSDGSYFRGVLATSLGGARNAVQRKQLQTIADAQTYRTCICTDSVVARGVIIAINWLLSTPMSALRYTEIDRPLEVLEVPLGERSVAKAAIVRSHARLRCERIS